LESYEVEEFDKNAIREIGETGLYEQDGFVFEDHLPKLKSLEKRINIYREMSTDPVVGSVIFAIEMHLRNVQWHIEEHEEGTDEELVNLVEDSLDNMSHTFQDFMSEVVSMLIYGFALHEVVYEKTNDGRILWRKWAPRSQDSIYKWNLDDQGGVDGVTQMPKYGTGQNYIPVEKLLLFRPSMFKNNPEGKSVLRTAYRPYYFKTRLETIEAISYERNLSGYPVLNVPSNVFGKSKRAKELRDLAMDIVTRIRKDEQMGSVMPPGWELKLLSAEGTTSVNIDEAITRYNLQIAQSLLSDIIMIGHSTSGGSYALSDKKYELFVIALTSWLDSIGAVLNKYAIPRLLELNGYRKEDYNCPKFVADPVQKIDPLKMANTMYRLSSINAVKPDDRLEKFFRNFLGLPQKDKETERNPHQEDFTSEGHTAGEARPDNETRPTDADGAYTQTEDSNL